MVTLIAIVGLLAASLLTVYVLCRFGGDE